jgi:hypothetical protein
MALAAQAAMVPAPRFTVGIELPSQVSVPRPVENALRAMGIGYFGAYVSNSPPWEGPEADTTAAMVELARRLGVRFTLDCHHRDPRPESVRAAAALGPAFEGVLIDELTHIRLLYPQFRPADGAEMLGDPATFRDLLDAHDKTVAGLQRLSRRFADLGAPRTGPVRPDGRLPGARGRAALPALPWQA